MARDESGTVVVAFVLGAITGAAVALLMAPASGEETRRLLADKAREGRERANDAARQGREYVGEAARQGREYVNRGKETITSAIERGREAYEQARGGGAAPAPGGGDTL